MGNRGESSQLQAGIPFVVLRHELPDGSGHFDWLFARENPPTTPLSTFRVAVCPDGISIGTVLDLEPIADHRLIYLDYEGPVSRDRGKVRRVAGGIYDLVDRASRQDLPGQFVPTDFSGQIRLRLHFSNRLPRLVQIWELDAVNGSARLLEVE